MKQRLSMIIVTAILLSAVSMFSLSVSAAEETISLYEAQSLVDKAHQFARGVHCFIEEVNPIADYSQGILVNLEEDSLGQQKYYRVNEEKLPGGSYEKMCEYARDIYTEDFAPYAYKFSPGYYGLLYQNENQTLSFNHCTVKVGGNYANHLPLFYRAENGVLYTSVYEMQGGVGVRLLDIYDSTYFRGAHQLLCAGHRGKTQTGNTACGRTRLFRRGGQDPGSFQGTFPGLGMGRKDNGVAGLHGDQRFVANGGSGVGAGYDGGDHTDRHTDLP